MAMSAFFVRAASARPWRVEQLPNGSKFSCHNCHHSPYGGSRNAFGRAVEKEVAWGSRAPFWSSVLVAKGSDGEGASNGEEFGDPDCDGKPTAGDTITNPGDANSKPPKSVKRVAPVIALRSSKKPFCFQFKTAKGVWHEIQASADLRKWPSSGPSTALAPTQCLLIFVRRFSRGNITG